MKTIFVFPGIFDHAPRLERCMVSLRRVYGDSIPIGLATWSDGQEDWQKLAERNDYEYYRTDPNVASETIGEMQISEHFWGLGYDEVFLLHNDMLIVRDFLPRFRAKMTGNWSFICPYYNFNGRVPLARRPAIPWENTLGWTGEHARRKQYALAVLCLIYNQAFLRDLRAKWPTWEGFNHDVMRKLAKENDINKFDLARDFLGYAANPVADEINVESGWVENITEYARDNPAICFMHGRGTIWDVDPNDDALQF